MGQRVGERTGRSAGHTDPGLRPRHTRRGRRADLPGRLQHQIGSRQQAARFWSRPGPPGRPPPWRRCQCGQRGRCPLHGAPAYARRGQAMIQTLVVDDDFRVAELHCAYVERVKGFAVAGRAHTGVEALQSVDRLRPDLVLLDVYLPDMSGLEVLQQLREDDHPPVDVISITAAREVESLRSAMRGGVVHYLIKPFLLATFEEKLLSYAAAHDRMTRLGEAQQTDVDRIFGALRTARNEPLPKGLSDATLDLIIHALSQSQSGLAATAVADAAGVSRVTARRYLDHLCQLGKAELTMRYGGPGRPEHRYRLANQAGSARDHKAQEKEQVGQ